MRWHFHPSFSVENGHYGNAVLSRLPMREVRCDALPSAKHREGRGAIWVEIDAPGGPVQVLATHLDLRGRQRRSQIQALLGEDWLGRWDGRTPLVLCGDFNTPPGSPLWRLLSERLGDAGRMVADRPPATFLRAMRLDYVFVSASVRVLDVQVPSDRLARRASDHLPLWADLTFAREAAEAPTDADVPGPPGASTPPGETNSTCAS
jgi:endonuclease/exonuclease/phosphatase family metal-dependent hydrolase